MSFFKSLILVYSVASRMCWAAFWLGDFAFGQVPPDSSKPYFSRSADRVASSAEQHLLPEFRFDDAAVYTLSALIDIAESHSPETKRALQEARVRAAALGTAKSELYPIVNAFLVGFTNQSGVLLFNHFVLQNEGLVEGGVSLDYTLLDFGARLDRVAAQRGLSQAANFAFNDAHRKLIFAVMHAYFQLLSAAGQRRAAEASLTSANAVSEAAQARYDNGLATLPDQLEARSTAAQASYDLQIRVGEEQKASGNLATLLTAPAYSQFKVQSIDELTIPTELPDIARDLIEKALRDRPDLIEQVARIDAAQAQQRNARKAYYPTLAFTGDYGRLRAWGDQIPSLPAYAAGDVYSATLRLSWNIVDGGRRHNELAQAKAEAEGAESALHVTQDRIQSEVWNAYVNAQTALRQRQAATALLQASQESYDMSLESYHDGVRNVLDVLQAERQLAVARSEDVTARAAVLNSLAEMDFQTGELLRRQTGQKP